MQHGDKILDLVEITTPYLAVVTVSLDRKIRCFKDYRLLWSLTENKSLKQLDFSPCHGGALLVSGFQAEFSVWDIQGAKAFISDASLRKTFDMGGIPVSEARFLDDSFFIVSVDVQGTIRIFNYKTEALTQTLKPELVNKNPSILVFSPSRFVLISRLMNFYNTKVVPNSKENGEPRQLLRTKTEQALAESRNQQITAALDCLYCHYTKTIFCLGTNSLKVYSVKTGQLVQFLCLNSAEMRCMAINQKERKLYIGDSAGCIRIYNTVTLLEIDKIDSQASEGSS